MWRALTDSDLAAVVALAAVIHPGYPEDVAVLAERLALYPSGCFLWERDRAARGYALSHPGVLGAPVELNTRIGRLPATPDAYHLHDISLLASERGQGAGRAIAAQLMARARAEGFALATLVSVNNSTAFWARAGFAPYEGAAAAVRAALATYGKDAVYMICRL